MSNGSISSLSEGQEWIQRLEDELVLLINDLMNVQGQISEVGEAALRYTILKTEEAIQHLELEIKMFEE